MPITIRAVFRNSLPVLKMYSSCHVYYTFSVLAVNFGTQPRTQPSRPLNVADGG